MSLASFEFSLKLTLRQVFEAELIWTGSQVAEWGKEKSEEMEGNEARMC